MNPVIQNIMHVANREIRQTMGKKGFLLALFLPIVLLAVICSLVPLAKSLIEHSQNLRTESVKIGVLGSDPKIMEAWHDHLEDQKLPNGAPLFDLHPITVLGLSPQIVEKNVKKKLFAKEWDAYVIISGDITQEGKCDFYTSRGFDLTLPHKLSNALRNAVRNERLKAEGLDPARIAILNRGITWNEFELTPETQAQGTVEGVKRRARFEDLIGPALICILMMFFLTFGTSQMLLRGVVEEKTSRVIELLLSSLSPMEIFCGKIMGFYVIGLTQLAVWLGCGAFFLPYFGMSASDYVPASYFLNYLVFLTTGYLFYATIFASLGAIVTDENESQQFQVIFNIFCVLPIMLYFVFYIPAELVGGPSH